MFVFIDGEQKFPVTLVSSKNKVRRVVLWVLGRPEGFSRAPFPSTFEYFFSKCNSKGQAKIRLL